MRAFHRYLMTLAFAGAAAAQSFAIAPSASHLAEHGPHLSGDTATLPLVLVKGYPFVEAQINGRKGNEASRVFRRLLLVTRSQHEQDDKQVFT